MEAEKSINGVEGVKRMKEYIGLKRSRKYEIEETEEVLGIDKDGFMEIRWTRFNPVDAKKSYGIRRLTGDGREVHISNRWDDFTVPEPEKKLANGGWDNNWPDVLKRKWPVAEKSINGGCKMQLEEYTNSELIAEIKRREHLRSLEIEKRRQELKRNRRIENPEELRNLSKDIKRFEVETGCKLDEAELEISIKRKDYKEFIQVCIEVEEDLGYSFNQIYKKMLKAMFGI